MQTFSVNGNIQYVHTFFHRHLGAGNLLYQFHKTSIARYSNRGKKWAYEGDGRPEKKTWCSNFESLLIAIISRYIIFLSWAVIPVFNDLASTPIETRWLF